MRAKKHLFKNIFSSRTVLLTLSAIIIIHIIVISFQAEYNKQLKREADFSDLVENVMDITHEVSALPANQQQAWVDSHKNKHLEVILSNHAFWANQITSKDYWSIRDTLRHPQEQIKTSIELTPSSWLNFRELNASSGVDEQLIFIFLEILAASAILYSVWSIERFIRPLKDFKSAADRLGVDLQSEPIEDLSGPMVVRETAMAMNQMQDRIKQLLQDRTQMLAAISHDLRTPITRLKLRAHFVEDPVEYSKIVNDLDEMEFMIAQILSFASETNSQEKKVNIDLVSFIQSICDEMIDTGQPVTFNTQLKRLGFPACPMALKRAVTNVINNAIKYGQSAHVSIKKSKELVELIIEDEGEGVPEEEMKKVLQPFYRSDPARTVNGGNVGLGLAITHEVVKSHGGELSLKNPAQGGLRVTLSFSLD